MKHVLRIILCVLGAALMIPALASAEAESLTWEERLAEARLKYNDETVNIYGLGRGGFRWGKFNVRVYASRNSPYVYFNIMDPSGSRMKLKWKRCWKRSPGAGITMLGLTERSPT